MKLCRDCAYYDEGDDEHFSDACKRTVSCFIHGTKTLCADPREERTLGDCGVDAKHFVLKLPVKVVYKSRWFW